ncbi:MAG: DUF551 domain-containing protein [Eikenella corrodens]|uniref:DUF551 domain-containing protein n=1 Tax=Eikenella corrodens TaxID=539 RepID=UPI00290DBD48|nr:DUF551 domain-containing protein [Eikenella corrodens]MDU4301786.1 DUF551 domain-containing protein [Eikenella corrodens]
MTPERIEQERNAFEAWYSRAYLPTAAHGRTFSKYQTGTYRLQHVHDAWQTWQARASQSEWISVKDRLPEIDEFVLVCRNWRGKLVQCVDRIRLYYDREKPKEEQKWYGFMYSDITHWQPLPAPPTTNPAA